MHALIPKLGIYFLVGVILVSLFLSAGGGMAIVDNHVAMDPAMRGTGGDLAIVIFVCGCVFVGWCMMTVVGF